MSYSFELWSHPEKLLKDHITGVFENGHVICQRLSVDSDFKILIDLCLLLHDFGKSSIFFQEYIHAIHDRDIGKITEEEFEDIKYKLGKRKNHARISSIWAFLAIRQKLDNPVFALIGLITVLRHHGHLTNLDEMLDFSGVDFSSLKEVSAKSNYEEFSQILEFNGYELEEFNHIYFEKKLDSFFDSRHFRRKWIKEIQKKLNSDTFYDTSLVFSILLASDKGECIFDGAIFQRDIEELPTTLVDIYKFKEFGPSTKNDLNQLRNEVYDSVNQNILKITSKDKFLSINVPTGIGKTLTVLNSCFKLLGKRNDLQKIIYCLPFTSVIDQNAEVISEILEKNKIESTSEYLLINHHLAELKYEAKTDNNEIDDNKSEFLITQFESIICVTTFYQLLYGLFTGKNNEIKKLHSFANSIVILDEVQSIPSKYWPLVKEALTKIADQLNITFIFVTATLPMIFSEEKGEIKELVKDKKTIFSSVDRIELETSLLKRPLNKEQFLEILEKDIDQNSGKSFLVILNTIKASKDIYWSLKDLYPNLIYLSTNIPPVERLKRIKKIKAAKENYIVISTQLVEAGVDIDLDIVYRDIAPLDSIFQSAGRCNRNAMSSKGVVKVFSLLDETKRYASYIYSKADLDTTQMLLKEKEIFNEGEFFDLANKYYASITKTPRDESLHILKEIEKLNYTNAFDPQQHKNAFELIEDISTYPAYVAIEEEANRLIVKYQDLIDTDFDSTFEKKREIKNVLKGLSKYSVSVPEKYAFKNDSFYYVISKEQKDFAYDRETGIEFEDGVAII